MARQQRRWKLLLPILAVLAAFSGFWAPQMASAADGINVSGMNQTHGIASGVSRDGFKVCVVWSQFDVADPQAWVRTLDVLTSTWSPALNQTATQVSQAGNGGVAGTRCTFDSNGNLHVAWQQKAGGGNLEIAHRFRNPNGAWSGVSIVSGNGDSPDLAADNDGNVWLAHHKFNGDNVPGEIPLFRWDGNWDQVTTFSPSGSGIKPRVGVDDPGYVHVAYQNGSGGRGYAFYNSNNGQKSSEIGIPGSNNAGNLSMAVNRDNGDVHIVYGKNSSEVYYSKKTGQGSTSFSGQVRIVSGDGNIYDPNIAVSGSQITVVFDNGNKDRIDYVTSGNNGGSWGGVASLANPGGQDQAPWIASDTSGNGYIAFAHSGFVYFINIIGFVPLPERCAGFADVRNTGPACPAITSLSDDGVINGYATDPPTFGPNKPVTRAENAAFIVRGLGWGTMPTGPKNFSDFGPLVGELRNASLILANACDPQGNCVANGYGDGRFGPNDGVTYAQVIAFVTRAMMYNDSWDTQSRPHPYQGVPAVHESDVRTYNVYAGALPNNIGTPNTEAGWNQPAPRAWVAVVIYQALQTIQGGQ